MGSRIKVLFLCTGNCCRSQMAEALLRHVGGDRFEAVSAGSHPAGYVHPLARTAMERLGVSVEGQDSKSWDVFADTAVDLVITLCDAAAAEPCPVWPGAPMTVHWPHPDPVALPGTDADRAVFADEVAARLKSKLERLVALDFAATPRDELLAAIRNIAR